MSFDQEPDGPIHGECTIEIHRLEAELYAARAVIEAARLVVRRYGALPDDAPSCGVGHLEIRLAAYDAYKEGTCSTSS